MQDHATTVQELTALTQTHGTTEQELTTLKHTHTATVQELTALTHTHGIMAQELTALIQAHDTTVQELAVSHEAMTRMRGEHEEMVREIAWASKKNNSDNNNNNNNNNNDNNNLRDLPGTADPVESGVWTVPGSGPSVISDRLGNITARGISGSSRGGLTANANPPKVKITTHEFTVRVLDAKESRL